MSSEPPRLAAALLAVSMAIAVPGCLSIEPPSRFLLTHRGPSELKAVSPEDAKLWVREFADGDKGSFAFWSDALKNDLVGNRGYALLEERPMKDRKGREGLELRFETTAGGEAQGYLATLFVFPGWLHNTIRVAELVAPREVFQKELPGVRAAIETIRP